MNEDELRRELSKQFLALSPVVVIRKRQPNVVGAQLTSASAPIVCVSDGCRDPSTLEPWEITAACR